MGQLTDAELSQLLNFVGYGRLNAPVWFLGMEEAGGGEDNLRKRLSFLAVDDCALAHQKLGITKHHWDKRTIQPTWRGMCCIMLELENRQATRENIRSYQADKLGRFQGNTLLTELMPIPKPSAHKWEYQDLIPQYKDLADYHAIVKPLRTKLLRGLVNEYKPVVLISYGKSYWSDYKDLFQSSSFSPNDSFEVGQSNETMVILTDHFTSRTMNNKWHNIVSLIQEQTKLSL